MPLKNLLSIYLLMTLTSTIESKDLSNLIKIVTRELRLVKKCLDANKLSLNIDMTNYIIFHSSSVNISYTFDIKIGKNVLKELNLLNFQVSS